MLLFKAQKYLDVARKETCLNQPESLVPGNLDAGFGGGQLEKCCLTVTRWLATLPQPRSAVFGIIARPKRSVALLTAYYRSGRAYGL